MNSVITAVGVLGSMGLVLGAGLAVAAKVFHIEVDPKVEQVRGALPGANCGACGFPGCDGLANAIASGSAPANACPVGGAACAEKIAEIMGVTASATDKKVARVTCGGTKCNAFEKFEYNGIQDCKAAALVSGGSKSCSYGCLGLGTCVRVCQFGAIDIIDGIAVINPEKCTSCGKCVSECPKAVISMVPYEQKVVVDCNSKEFGKDVKVKCTVGCIGCQICVKACPFGAMEFENNLARINYEKCTNCMICAEKCPTKAIWADFDNRDKAFIHEDKCIGCTICKKQCPVDAIEGELKSKHEIIEEKCIGCGACAKKCPKDAIEMR